MSWGYKILTTILVFVAGMVFMVVLAFRQNVDMIDQNYYSQEMEYQSKIDAAKNLSSQDKKNLGIIKDNALVFNFNSKQIQENQSVRLAFICYSNPQKDTILQRTVPASGTLQLNAFTQGLFKMRLSWRAKETEYYLEKDVLL